MAAIAKLNLLSPLDSTFHRNESPLISGSVLPKLRDFRLANINVPLKRSRNSSILPVIRAQNSPGMG
ncbi:putative Nitrogen regulatory protein P-II [Corchorus olitorius]|uniref:Nitrogen regulatory protein P-II n=1 Tax=Corchorus olitorius TaxID=93759 RepID=A0A1R3II55_9ROSI|nr:putative Nitrogen regulatory protein P-II [Corchorus olitorius]